MKDDKRINEHSMFSSSKAHFRP